MAPLRRALGCHSGRIRRVGAGIVGGICRQDFKLDGRIAFTVGTFGGTSRAIVGSDFDLTGGNVKAIDRPFKEFQGYQRLIKGNFVPTVNT